MAWREKQGAALVRRGCPLLLGGGGDDAAGAAPPAAPDASDPVFRYDPERAKYAPEDYGVSVPVILGIAKYVSRVGGGGADAPGAPPRRFTAWKVAAKAKMAAELWAAWSAEAAAVAAGK